MDVDTTWLFIMALVAFILFAMEVVRSVLARYFNPIAWGGAVGFLALVFNWWPD
jgi:hypothetical protein